MILLTPMVLGLTFLADIKILVFSLTPPLKQTTENYLSVSYLGQVPQGIVLLWSQILLYHFSFQPTLISILHLIFHQNCPCQDH